MTARKREGVVEYITKLQGLMHLTHWDIGVVEGSAAPGNYAQVQTITGRYSALIHLCDEWESLSREDERQYVVHELLHVHQAMIHPFLSVDLKEHLAPAMWELVNAGFDRQMEYMTDDLSNIIAPLFPLRLR